MIDYDGLVRRLGYWFDSIHTDSDLNHVDLADDISSAAGAIDALLSEVKRADQSASECVVLLQRAEADANRYRWSCDILGGDNTPLADRKAIAIAHQLMMGVDSIDAAIDAAMKDAP